MKVLYVSTIPLGVLKGKKSQDKDREKVNLCYVLLLLIEQLGL